MGASIKEKGSSFLILYKFLYSVGSQLNKVSKDLYLIAKTLLRNPTLQIFSRKTITL